MGVGRAQFDGALPWHVEGARLTFSYLQMKRLWWRVIEKTTKITSGDLEIHCQSELSAQTWMSQGSNLIEDQVPVLCV